MLKSELIYDDDYLFSVSKVFSLCGEKVSFTVNSEICFEMYRKLSEFSKIKEKFIENFGPAITNDTMFFNKLKEFMHCIDDMQSYLEDILAQDEIFDVDAEDVIKLHLPEALCEFENYLSDMHDLDLAAQKLGSYRAIQRETRDTGADMMFFGGAGIKGAMSAVLTSVVAGAGVAAIQSVGDSITASNDKKLIDKELVKLHKKYNFAKLFGSALNKLIGGIMTEYTLIVKTRVPRYKYIESEVAKFKSNDTNSVVLNNLEKQYSKKNISYEVFTSKIMQLIKENPYDYKCYNAILRYVPSEAKHVNEIISFMGMEDMFEGTIYQNFENILNDFYIEKYPHSTTLAQVKEDYNKLIDLKNEYSNYQKFSEDIQIRINLYAEVVELMEFYNKSTIYDFLNCGGKGELYSVENALKKYREDYVDEKEKQDAKKLCIEAMKRFEEADLDFSDYSEENRIQIEETFVKSFGGKDKKYIKEYKRFCKSTSGYKKYTKYLDDYTTNYAQNIIDQKVGSIDFKDYSLSNASRIRIAKDLLLSETNNKDLDQKCRDMIKNSDILRKCNKYLENYLKNIDKAMTVAYKFASNKWFDETVQIFCRKVKNIVGDEKLSPEINNYIRNENNSNATDREGLLGAEMFLFFVAGIIAILSAIFSLATFFEVVFSIILGIGVLFCLAFLSGARRSVNDIQHYVKYKYNNDLQKIKNLLPQEELCQYTGNRLQIPSMKPAIIFGILSAIEIGIFIYNWIVK